MRREEPSLLALEKMGEIYSPGSCTVGTMTPFSRSFFISMSSVSNSRKFFDRLSFGGAI